MKKLLFAFVCIMMTIPIISKAQNVLVSEYSNVSASAVGEWVELIINEDNTSIVGYKMRDNASTGLWMGGVIFNDVSLWKNLRKGTVIIINDRGNSAPDILIKDGYIEVSAENTTYFTKYIEPSSGATDWEGVLNFNQDTDILNILDQNGDHVHAIGHTNDPPLTIHSTMPAPKSVILDNANLTNGASVKVWGSSINDYNDALKTVAASKLSNKGSGTKGYANQGETPAKQDVNQLFWRELRQPTWFTPSLTLTETGTGVHLKWSACLDPYPADNTTGYIVVRIEKAFIATATAPVDGKIYNTGDALGSGKVVMSRQGSFNLEYDDNFTFKCGEEFVYRVYAFRYEASDDKDMDNTPLKGRGRSYNETAFASAEILKPGPTKPVLKIVGGAAKMCTDDTLSIYSGLGANTFTYQWKIDGNDHSSQKYDTLRVRVKTGSHSYTLTITDENGCVSTSDAIVIQGVARPEANLYFVENKVQKLITQNETKFICPKDSVVLFGPGGAYDPNYSLAWYRNGVKLPETSMNLTIKDVGLYYLVVENSNMCPDTSYSVFVMTQEFNLGFDQLSMTFQMSFTETEKTQNLVISNKTGEAITIQKDSVLISGPFTIVSPSFPWTIPANGLLTVQIKATLSDPGAYSGALQFRLPCKNKWTIKLSGLKYNNETQLVSNPSEVNFGDILSCDLAKVDTTIVISVLTANPENVVLLSPRWSGGQSNLDMNTISWIDTLAFGQNEIKVWVKAQAQGLERDTILIPYRPESKKNQPYDTLKIPVSVNVITPDYSLPLSEINFGVFADCQSKVDSFLVVTNTGDTDIILNEKTADARITYKNLPLNLGLGKSDTLFFTFTPITNKEDFSVSLVSEQCQVEKSFSVKGEIKGKTFSFDKTSIDFGAIGNCSSVTYSVADIINVTNADANAKIKTITIDSPFSVSGVSEGMTLGAATNFKVNISPNAIGNISGTLKIVFEPCDVEKTVALSANVQDVDFSIAGLTGTSLAFGQVQSGATGTAKLTFTNNTLLNDTIKSVSGVVAPFSILTPSNLIGMVLLPGEFVEVTFQYAPQAAGAKDDLSVIIELSSNCTATKNITLSGTSEPLEVAIPMKVILPNKNVAAVPGKNLYLPVQLSTLDGYNLADANITKINIDLIYDPNMLYPAGIIGTQTAESTFKSYDFTEVTAGRGRLTLEPRTPANFNNGTELITAFLVLVSKTDNTTIYSDSISTQSSEKLVLVHSDTTNFSPIEDCFLASRSIELGEGAKFAIMGNPVNEKSKLVFRSISDEELGLEVYSSDGRLVKTLFRGHKKPGLYEMSLPIADLPSGTYFVKMYNGIIVFTEPMIISK